MVTGDYTPGLMGKMQTAHAPAQETFSLVQKLREGKEAALRERKAQAQKEFMIARRIITQTYRDFEPDDLPVDLQRLLRDLEITRDQRIADAKEEIAQAYDRVIEIVEEVTRAHPKVYARKPAAPKTGEPLQEKHPLGVPPKVVKLLTAEKAKSCMQFVCEQGDEGCSLVALCVALDLNTPALHRGAKLILPWMRERGLIVGRGPGGKGKLYVRTSKLTRLLTEGPLASGTGDEAERSEAVDGD